MSKVVAASLFLFLLAGLLEVGGGYLMWLWLRDEGSILLGVAGASVLFLYGVVPTLQRAHFGRVYAAYGGVFVAVSLLWGWLIDGVAPDAFDIAGGAVALLDVLIIMFWPRGEG